MTWIETVSPEEATGELAHIYEALGKARGGVADVHRALSLHPRAILAHLEIYKAVMFGRSSLDRRLRERLAVVVSRENGCTYCMNHHREALLQLGEDPALAAALFEGREPPGTTARDRALYAFAANGARDPATSGEDGVEALRAQGLDDRAILDATLTVSYFCFVNRIVLLLGISLEEDYTHCCGEMPGDG